MKKIIFVFCLLLASYSYGTVDELLIKMLKESRSVYSGNCDIDAKNNLKIAFETTLTNQKVFLRLDVAKLNSAFLSVVNSTSESKNNFTVPEVQVNLLSVTVDGQTTSQCNGSDILADDISCTSKSCTIVQRLISDCNENDCWTVDSSIDRKLAAGINESFSLSNDIDISNCVTNNIQGTKHVILVETQDVAAGTPSGGTINYSLSLQNDVISEE